MSTSQARKSSQKAAQYSTTNPSSINQTKQPVPSDQNKQLFPVPAKQNRQTKLQIAKGLRESEVHTLKNEESKGVKVKMC